MIKVSVVGAKGRMGSHVVEAVRIRSWRSHWMPATT